MAQQTVIGFFDDQQEAQRAAEQLQSRGISLDSIDVSRAIEAMSVVGGTSSGTIGMSPVSGSTQEDNSVNRTSDGRTLDEGARNTNQVNDFFNNLFSGSDNEDADRYSRVAQNSNAIVTVHAQSEEEAKMAAEVLDDAGALDVDERSSQLGFTNSPSRGRGTRENTTNETGQSLPNIQESLEKDKEEVESRRGGVRSRIIERPVEGHTRLREEYIHINSRPIDVNRQAPEAEGFNSGNEVNRRDEVKTNKVYSEDVDKENLENSNMRADGSDANTDLDDTSRDNRGLYS